MLSVEGSAKFLLEYLESLEALDQSTVHVKALELFWVA